VWNTAPDGVSYTDGDDVREAIANHPMAVACLFKAALCHLELGNKEESA